MVPPELLLKFLNGRQLMCQLDNFQGAIRRNLGLHFGRVEYCPQECVALAGGRLPFDCGEKSVGRNLHPHIL